jgi:serine/threonine protein kinase
MYNSKTKKKSKSRIDKIYKISKLIKSNSNIDSYEIIKELGYGFMGTVYLVEKNKKKYAMKIEHVLESDIINKNSKIFRENRFYEKFANKYPEYFVTMKEFDIIDNCKHIQKYPPSHTNKFDNMIQNLANSVYCTRRIITLIDNSLLSIINTLTYNQIYSAIIQIYYITNFLHKNKYIQVDAGIHNVGYIKTNIKYIKIDNHMIPTFGYIYKLYDFGSVLHISDTTFSNFNFIKNKELLKIASYLYENSIIYIDIYSKKKYITSIMNSPEFEDIKNILKKPAKSPYIYIRMYEILNNEKFKDLINLETEKQKNIKFYIPKEDILYYIKEINNNNNSINIINYFLKKIT